MLHLHNALLGEKFPKENSVASELRLPIFLDKVAKKCITLDASLIPELRIKFTLRHCKRWSKSYESPREAKHECHA